MLRRLLHRASFACALVLPAALTCAALGSRASESSNTQQAPAAVVVGVADTYSAPHPFIPSATGVLGPEDVQETSDESAWIALRSPTTEATRDATRPHWRTLLSARTSKRWRGDKTRGRLVSQLRLALEDYGVSDWVYPIDANHVAGSPFGGRRDPIRGDWRHHGGQDFGCRRGTPIYAVADGVVLKSQGSKTAGRHVVLEHEGRGEQQLITQYLHMQRRLVRRGEEVRRGQQIGTCGSTGSSTSPHLHFAIKIDKKPINPFTVYPQVLAGEELEKQNWDQAIALAIEENRLDELVSGDSVPREVQKVVREYKRSRGRKAPRLLSSSSEPRKVAANDDAKDRFSARGGAESDDDDAP